MPKAEKGSLKDLGKKIKSKGLQKLKYFCQMCEKQCRDANGFKCHLTSESHLRQMKIFSEHAGSFMDRYSRDFEKMYLDTLRMRHSTSRTAANAVYQEVIQDKGHIHMNSTIWASLTDFCKYLGKMGKCVVEETERGWYVTYIERDVSKLHQEEVTQQRLEAEQAAEQATQERMVYQRVEAAKALDRAGGVLHTEATKLERNSDEETATIQLALSNAKKPSGKKTRAPLGKSVFGDDDDDSEVQESQTKQESARSTLSTSRTESERPLHPSPKPPLTGNARSSTSGKEDEKKSNKRVKTERDNNEGEEDEPWLHRDILVRIINNKVADGIYFLCKAAVDKVVDGFTAEVTVMDDNKKVDGDVLRLDQEDLETVVPKRVDEKVRIVRGKHRGEKAVVIELDKKKCRAILELKDRTILNRVDYDDFSKLA